MFTPKYKLLDWIDANKINYNWLSLNTHNGAIEILKENQYQIIWWRLSMNTNDGAIALLRENSDEIDWYMLSKNANDGAIALLRENPNKIDWNQLSGNTNDGAIALLLQKENQDAGAIGAIGAINWKQLSANTNDGAIALLRENPDKIDWNALSGNNNDGAIALLQENPDKINLYWLCGNSNNVALTLFKKYYTSDTIDKIYWHMLSQNTSDDAIALLRENPDKIGRILSINANNGAIAFLSQKENQDKISWDCLSQNPSIFELDKDAMRKCCKPFAEELASVVFHPRRICALVEKYGFDVLDEI